MKVAFFWIDKKEAQTNVSDGKKNREIVHAMIASVKKNIPDAEVIQLTDQDSGCVGPVDGVYRFGDHPEFLMPARMEYQYKYLRDHCDYNEDVIFLDPDIIVQKDLTFLFDDKGVFDIALTGRDNLGALSDAMPFNAGVVLARNTHKAQEFFDRARMLIDGAPEKLKRWYGDQLAMKELVGDYDDCTDDMVENHGIDFMLLACNKYNYSPIGDEMVRALNGGEDCKTLERLQEKYVVHFKGGLKDSMNEYWNKTNSGCC